MPRLTREREPIDTTAEVETPEHVRFHFRIAGPAKRTLAYLIDGLIRASIVLVLGLLLLLGSSATTEELMQASSGLMLIVLFGLEWGYYVFCEMVWSGRSPGKRALGLRVVTESGRPLSLFDSVLRNLLRAADFLPGMYALGVLVMAREPRFRRLGDLVAGTMVIVEERHRVASPLRIEPPPTARELARLPARIPLSADELDAIELFLRRSRLSPLREEELAAIVAPTYARRMNVRYSDAARFLALIHHRAHEKRV